MRIVLPDIELRIGQNVNKDCSAKPDPGHGHYKDRVQVQGLTILIGFHWLFTPAFLAHLFRFEGIYSWKHSVRRRKKWVRIYGQF
jgi:hypothetical protein